MKYMGSKNRISKHIIPIMVDEADKRGITTWVEPFVGGGNSIDKVPDRFKRIGSDANPHAVQALIAIRDMVDILPETLTEEEYKQIRGCDPEPIKSWLRFICSYSGRFDEGFARHGNLVKYRKTPLQEGRINAQKQSPLLQGVQLFTRSYDNCNDYTNCLIYCDPPYKGKTSYRTQPLDHDKFWEWCRGMSEHNIVFVSEYEAPSDFVCVWSGEVKTNFDSKRKSSSYTAIEKLFEVPHGRQRTL